MCGQGLQHSLASLTKHMAASLTLASEDPRLSPFTMWLIFTALTLTVCLPCCRLSTSHHAEAKIPSRYPASACGRVPFSLHWPSSEHQPQCHSLQKAQPGCFSVTNHSTEPILHSFTCYFLCLFMGFSRQEYWSGLPFPSAVDHILSELSTMTCPSWVALHSMAHSFIELDKAVVHVIRLVSFLWLWFSVCLPSDREG